MWTWDQSAGVLYREGEVVSRGFSGAGRGKNNPSLQDVKGVGPIPRGRWRMMGVYNSKNVGPFTITLWRVGDTKFDDFDSTTGRSAFRIHGDSIRAPGTASRGCIILPRNIREMMWRSGDHDINVID